MYHASMSGDGDASGMGQVLAFPGGGLGATVRRDPGVQALQVALRQLGTTVRDPLLARMGVDGILGPATVRLVNRAFTTHIGPGQAPAGYRTGALGAIAIREHASQLAQLVQAESARRATAAVTTAQGRLGPGAVPTARSGPAHFVSGNPRDLQAALKALGAAVRDGVLMRIVVDGKLGPASVAAVNRAFTTHIGPGQAPAQYRTGSLTLQQIVTEMANLIMLIQREAARRGTVAVTTAQGRLDPNVPVGPPLPPRQAAMELQQALNYLAQESRDKRLQVKVDGKIGPGTAKAVNIALTTHVGPYQAPAGLRTGTLSVATIIAGATQIGAIIRKEAARRVELRSNTGPGAFGPGGGGAPVPMGPPLAPRAAAIMLQQALAYLARETHDRRLSVKADGAIGPATLKATNIAFSTHIGPYQAGGVDRSGNLSLAYVKANAQMLGTLVNREAARRHFGGGSGGSPSPETGCPPGFIWDGRNCSPTGGIVFPTPASRPPNRATNKVLQTRLAQLGRVNRDSTLMAVKPDGIVGPRTVAAVNKAFTTYITSAPGTFTSGRLTAGEVVGYAATLSEYIGSALQAQGTSPATAPPEAEVGPNAEGDGAAVVPGADQTAPPADGGGADTAPPPPPPPPVSDEGGGAAPGGGGQMQPAPGGGVTPTEAGMEPDSGGSKIPWVPIAIGVGLAAVTVVVVLVSKKSSSGAPTYAYKQPARTARRRAA